MKEFWDKRYNQKNYVYGELPNQFFKESLEKYQLSGKLLLPAEGEGRNAVYASKHGFDVTAFDYSAQAKEKALLLADQHNTSFTYEVGEFSAIEIDPNSFDVVALIYAHFPPHLKEEYYKKIASYVKPDGYVIAELFSKDQLAYREQSGGPGELDMLFSMDEIKSYFQDFEILELEKKLVRLSEGPGHNGTGSVIRFVGKKA